MSLICTLDFETYYTPTYSLSKITTEEYVRHPDFEVIGLGISFGGPPKWIKGPNVRAAIESIDWSEVTVVAQNTAFDGAILAWHYGVNPYMWCDTLGMSRALNPHAKSHSLAAQAERLGAGVKGDEVLKALGKRYADFTPYELSEYGKYCKNDVTLTQQLFAAYLARGFPRQECRLIDLTLRMFIEPRLILDAPALRSHLCKVQQNKRELLDTVRDHMLAGKDPDHYQLVFAGGDGAIKKQLMSNVLFADLLRSFGTEPPTKISPKTGKVAYAFAKTDDGMKALQEHDDERVQALVAARLGNKSTLEETRTERFIGMAGRGPFPVPLRYYGAHSGRWSGQDSVNLQNLPSRGPNAKRIKKAILAPTGYVIVDCDSAQIEARCLAWEAEQEDLVQAFANKEDIYSQMASKIYNRTVDRKRVVVAEDGTETKPDEFEGHVGKATVLGSGYGMGANKFQIHLAASGIKLPLPECQRINKVYRDTVPQIVQLWYAAQRGLEALMYGMEYSFGRGGMFKVVPGKGITLPSGLFMQYPDLRNVYNFTTGKTEMVYTSKGVKTRIYGPKVIENLTQAVARCIVAEQMLRIAKRYKVVLTVHDSVAALVPIEEQQEGVRFIEE